MEMALECIICRKASGKGISILGKFICRECEKTLVNIEVDDEGYDWYKDMIKKNIYGDTIIRLV